MCNSLHTNKYTTLIYLCYYFWKLKYNLTLKEGFKRATVLLREGHLNRGTKSDLILFFHTGQLRKGEYFKYINRKINIINKDKREQQVRTTVHQLQLVWHQ